MDSQNCKYIAFHKKIQYDFSMVLHYFHKQIKKEVSNGWE